MRESIEDRIIAYFDGRMTDGESAELLHRVSVSPEIRKLFREHEMLRELARSAQASAVVRPELEADLFSRIEALAAAEQAPVIAPLAEEKRRRVIPFFWSHWRLGLATALGAFVLGTAITLGPELFDRDGSENGATQSTAKLGANNSTDAPPIVTREDITKENDIAVEAEAPVKQDFDKTIRGDRDYEARQARNERPALLGNTTNRSYKTHESYTSQQNSGGANSIADATEVLAVRSEGEVTIAPISTVAAKSAMPISIGAEKGNIPVFRAEDIEQDEASFEAAIETSSGFAYPADGPGIQPFADPRVSLGYFIDRHNIIGVRVTSGLFQSLPESSVSSNGAYTSISRNLEQERMNNYGAYYTRRVYGVLNDLMNLDATVGAGYISNGYTLSAELGLRLPFSSKLFGNISFALTRVHMNAPSMEEITNSVSLEDGPVLIEGSDVQNTINGRIHYGISYQF